MAVTESRFFWNPKAMPLMPSPVGSRPIWTRFECCGLHHTGDRVRIVDGRACKTRQFNSVFYDQEVYGEIATIIAIISEVGATETVFVCQLENPDPAKCTRILASQRQTLTQVASDAFAVPPPHFYRDDLRYVTLVMAGIRHMTSILPNASKLWGFECTRCDDGFDYMTSNLPANRVNLVNFLKPFGNMPPPLPLMPAPVRQMHPPMHSGRFEPWHGSWAMPSDHRGMREQLTALNIADSNTFERHHVCDEPDHPDMLLAHDHENLCEMCVYDWRKKALHTALQTDQHQATVASPSPPHNFVPKWQLQMHQIQVARHHRRNMGILDHEYH